MQPLQNILINSSITEKSAKELNSSNNMVASIMVNLVSYIEIASAKSYDISISRVKLKGLVQFVIHKDSPTYHSLYKGIGVCMAK